MKLTQYQKDAIVRAIFQDIPHASSKDIIAAVQKDLVKAMSPACQKAYKLCSTALKTESSYDLTFERDRACFIIGDANFEETAKPWREAKQNYLNARASLQGLVNSVSTLKQLTEMLPEFVSYFPQEGQPIKNLPAVANVVSTLVKLGWKAK